MVRQFSRPVTQGALLPSADSVAMSQPLDHKSVTV